MITLSIQRLRAYIQMHKKDIILFLLVFCIALFVFAFGYILGRDASPAPIIIQKMVN